jgi:hypothetical protein
MERRNGLFAPISEFEWDTFENPHKDDRVTITVFRVPAAIHYDLAL